MFQLSYALCNTLTSPLQFFLSIVGHEMKFQALLSPADLA